MYIFFCDTICHVLLPTMVIFQAEDQDKTSVWYRQLQYYAQGMGVWRKRRNALANIMISGVGFRS